MFEKPFYYTVQMMFLFHFVLISNQLCKCKKTHKFLNMDGIIYFLFVSIYEKLYVYISQ